MSNTVLIVEDDENLREALVDTLTLAGIRVESAQNGQHACLKLNQMKIALVVSDVAMGGMDGHELLTKIKQQYPSVPVILMTAYADVARAVSAIRSGAVDYLVKPFEPKALLDLVHRYIHHHINHEKTMVAVDERSKKLFQMAEQVACSDATVLISGESGTGKEVIAQHIHQHSRRAKQSFVAINCAAIPENMLEATLFGYEKGAFTGAYQASAGKFEQAQNGTLLLDEITEMDLPLQAKILRVLQERELERLGGKKTISLNVRLIATSNRNMLQAVQNGTFREDLYYRLNVVPLHSIALKDRPDDIVPLAEFILARHSSKMQRQSPLLSDNAKQALLQYHWPGNVRELDNIMQRALVFQSAACIDVTDLHFESIASNAHTVLPQKDTETTVDLKQREYQLIIDEIKRQQGCRRKTAEALGISPRTLRYKIARMRESGFDIPNTKDIERV